MQRENTYLGVLGVCVIIEEVTRVLGIKKAPYKGAFVIQTGHL